MARVFISYRRADGQYAVGWIEERLAQLDEVTSVRTAFRDNTTLRLGDDLPDVLAAEVEGCDVLIAVIGPHWRGDRPDGTARILDPNDWIAREIHLAMRFGKRIVPVLISGMEPLAADTLPPEVQSLTELLALRFNDVEDLDRLDEEVREYLDGLDRERARLQGLDEPIVVPSFRQPWWVWFVAVVAGLVGGVLAYSTVDGTRWFLEGFEALWLAYSIEVGTWAFFSVVGVSYFHRELADIIEVRWRTVVRTGVLAVILIVLTVRAFADDRGTTNIREAVLAVVLLSPWIVMMLGASWSAASSEALRDRARVLATHRHNQVLATPVLVLALSLAVVTTAVSAARENLSTGEAAFLLISLGVFLTLIVLGALVYSSRELAHQSDLVRLAVADLAPAYRRNVDAVLADRPIDSRSPLVWMAAVPTVVAVVCVAAMRIW